jgi:hypothetical protein
MGTSYGKDNFSNLAEGYILEFLEMYSTCTSLALTPVFYVQFCQPRMEKAESQTIVTTKSKSCSLQ